MFTQLTTRIGRGLAAYLNGPIRDYASFAVSDSATLAGLLQPADVLLVEGNRRISTAIKYLTQSTWSHAGLYVGENAETGTGPDAPLVVEADLEHGVRTVALSSFRNLNTRICRPISLTPAEQTSVCTFMLARLGNTYDLKNIVDLCRYLLPTPPVPVRWRRRMLALGSGDPTRAICSSLIAQAFQSVRYPILPWTEQGPASGKAADQAMGELLRIRHHSLFTPRDFDLSPYFRVIKPSDQPGFDHRRLEWAD